MKINNLTVQNFRAITNVELSNLSTSVVIAGPNGCGKSCILDAIRLVKSVYGGYNPNEWQNWFGEFQINLKEPREVLSVFQDKSAPMRLSVQIGLSNEEVDYLRGNAETLIAQRMRQEVATPMAIMGEVGLSVAAEARVRRPNSIRRVAEELPEFLRQLNSPIHIGELNVTPDAQITTAPSLVLETLFGIYDPSHIGIIDFHGANRNYNREQLGGINLNIQSTENRLRQHALYNHANKYANLKSEMAASYVRHLLALQANPSHAPDDSLTLVLKELFSTFFPGKEFLGPKPTSDGKLLFPVRTQNGAEHDIDELSSGEKEVLYGYLRLRNSAPRNSVLMIDEPELHLNPRLIQGLASFYHRHLGRAQGNQIWLVTHSDALIRESVGQEGFSVYHMQPTGVEGAARNQAARISAASELDRCVIDLVGDLAVFSPGAKLVIFEGGGDARFDIRATTALFPKTMQMINPISGGSKRRVNDLYGLLVEAHRSGHLPMRFFSITDSDSEGNAGDQPRSLSWGAYHIENYLLEPHFILKVLDEIGAGRRRLRSVSDVYECLKDCAEKVVPELVAFELRKHANQELVRCLDLRTDPRRPDVAIAIHQASIASADRVARVLANELSPQRMEVLERSSLMSVRSALDGDSWRDRVPGRSILKRFVSEAAVGIGYEPFRDLILARMSDAEFQPIGMAKVLNAIVADNN